jgi:hypothetical protein
MVGALAIMGMDEQPAATSRLARAREVRLERKIMARNSVEG